MEHSQSINCKDARACLHRLRVGVQRRNRPGPIRINMVAPHIRWNLPCHSRSRLAITACSVRCASSLLWIPILECYLSLTGSSLLLIIHLLSTTPPTFGSWTRAVCSLAMYPPNTVQDFSTICHEGLLPRNTAHLPEVPLSNESSFI